MKGARARPFEVGRQTRLVCLEVVEACRRTRTDRGGTFLVMPRASLVPWKRFVHANSTSARTLPTNKEPAQPPSSSPASNFIKLLTAAGAGSQQRIAMSAVVWEFFEADLVPGGFWAPMATSVAAQLGNAQSGEFYVEFTNERTGKPTIYCFNLDTMEQINCETQYRRQIRRVVQALPTSAATVPPCSGAKEECCVCACRSVTAAMKAEKVSRHCKHAHRNICDNCMEDYVCSGLRSSREIACVDCRVKLDDDEAMRWAQKAGDTHAATMFDQRLLTKGLSHLPDFCWCAHGCGMGQEHPERDQAPMQCRKCKKQTCFRHRCSHEGMTCAEYEAKLAADELSKMLQNSSAVKRCPKCGEGIERSEGCARMTCSMCTHTFCWDCGADYDGPSGIRAVGNDAHLSACPWHTKNLPSCRDPEE